MTTAKTAKVQMKDMMRSVKVEIKVLGVKSFMRKAWVANKLIGFAVWLLGVKKYAIKFVDKLEEEESRIVNPFEQRVRR